MKVLTARRSTGALAVSVLAASALSGAVAADPGDIDWKPAVDVRDKAGVELEDVDFSRSDLAIASQSPASSGPKVVIHTGTIGGFFDHRFARGQSRQASTELCYGLAQAVYAHREGPGDWIIEKASGNIGGKVDYFEVDGPVSSATGLARFPDVACTQERVFVTWYQREGDVDRLQLAHALTFGDFSEPIDLGGDDKGFGRSLAVAGVDDSAYTVFARADGDLRFKRWSVGDGLGKPVTGHPTQVIGPGTPQNSADSAVIAAAGDKVAVAWFKCNAIHARVSNDQGQTWGPLRSVVSHAACGGDFGASPDSIAIRNDRIVMAYGFAGLFSGGSGLISTTDDFASFTDDTISEKQLGHLVGLVKADGTKLADVFDAGDRIRYRRQQ